MLEVSGLSWPPDNPILRNLALKLAPGERVAIAGPSGAGKSSLLRCIVGLEPHVGEVRFRGELIVPDTILQLRRAVTLVPQVPSPVADSVEENLAFAREHGVLNEAEQAELLRLCGLAEIPPDRRFDRLSVGERQRLCFVRSMTLDPAALLLDEPTASLDRANTEALEEIVESWQQQDATRAVVWVTHDEAQAARVADRILHLRDGRLEAS